MRGEQTAGPWALRLDGADLRRVSWHGHEVLRWIGAVVRDTGWATVPADLESVRVERGDDAGAALWRLTWEADHGAHGMPVRAQGRLELTEDALMCTYRARATAGLEHYRIGLVLLHPLALAGSRVRWRDPAGTTRTAALPTLVAPQPLVDGGPAPAIGPFTRLEIDGPVHMALSVDGDLFELEDQRNWTDASYKTYSTPLALPRPHRLGAGEEITQSIRLDLAPAPPVPLGALVDPRGTGVPAERDLHALAGLVDHARVEVRLSTAADRGRARDLCAAVAAHLPLELMLLADDGTDWDELARLCARETPVRVLVVAADGRGGTAEETTPPALLERARTALAGIEGLPVGGGTLFSLCELQRHDIAHLDPVCFSATPTVHARDETSVRETVESLPAVLATAAAVSRPGARIVVGPLQARERALEEIARPSGRRGDAGEAAGALPPDVVEETVVALARGADAVCALELGDLVVDARPTGLGRSLSRARARIRSTPGEDRP